MRESATARVDRSDIADKKLKLYITENATTSVITAEDDFDNITHAINKADKKYLQNS
jgi:hypothetical protein